MASKTESFRVIIAGGGVVGLVLANALEKAGIDYLVLEKGEIAPHLGASISVLCHTSKVFDQLGVWKSMLDHCVPLLERQHFDERGRLFEDTAVLRMIAEWTARPFLFMERWFYIRALYDNLPTHSRQHKVRDHVGVVSFREDDESVTVVTDTDEEIHGSILVGADGIHGTVRKLLAGYLASTDPSRARGFEQGFMATYRAIFGTSRNARTDDPNKPFMANGSVHNVYYREVSGVSACGVDGLIFWFLYVKEDAPSTAPETPRYTEQDAQETIDVFGHRSLGPGYTFADLWESRVRAAMVPLEEGVLDGPWNSGGRVVLMGDTVMKATVNAGLGANTHVEGVCHLVNELYSLLKDSPCPSREAVQAAYQSYEGKQRPRARTVVNVSGYITRFEAMETWYWRLARVLSPWIPDSLKAKGFLDFSSSAPTLDFLPEPEGRLEPFEMDDVTRVRVKQLDREGASWRRQGCQQSDTGASISNTTLTD